MVSVQGLPHPRYKESSFGDRPYPGSAAEVFLHAGYVKTKIRCEIATEQEKAAIGEREKGWKRPNDDSRA